MTQWLRVRQQRYLHSSDESENQISSLSSSSSTSTAPTTAPTEPLQQDVPQAPQAPAPDPRWDAFKQSIHFPRATPPAQYKVGQEVVVHGFLGKRRDKGAFLAFCDLETSQHVIQIVSTWKEEGSIQQSAHQSLKEIPSYSPVCVEGTLVNSDRTLSKIDYPNHINLNAWDLRLRSITCLNAFPKNIIVSKDAVWSPAQRHLQLRFDPLLRQRLTLRATIMDSMRRTLKEHGFHEVETPLLFKSTPEGAREFLVPTRRQGYAYALPQSPQQYKQILMASGFPGYFQFAKCFRDEDHRADRQPEFTQLDLEIPFATGSNVRYFVTGLVNSVFKKLSNDYTPTEINGIWHPVHKGPRAGSNKVEVEESTQVDDSSQGLASNGEDGDQPENSLPRYPRFWGFPRMTYRHAMRRFGSDKPDLRITRAHASEINRIDSFLPAEFIHMITHLENPIVEAVKFRFDDDVATSPRQTANFIREFMDKTLPSTPGLKLTSPGSTPGVFVFDSSQPLSGFAALGHEAGQRLAELATTDWKRCRDGDVVLIHARENDDDDYYRGAGSTDLGRLRVAIHDSALKQGLIRRQLPSSSFFQPVWIYGFPLFTPNSNNNNNNNGGEEQEDPGQGGTSGFSSTHHPFTAPLDPEDVDLLRTNPLRARADHYDLVINGVEVGGGSRRIHVAEVQEYVMRDVLGMDDAGVARFAHLLEALRAGCPPHAGFAFGFDRLLTVLCDVPSVRDVIAFPKNNKGEDLLVGSPSKTSKEQQKIYHLFRTE